jgi:hypothetical protein
MSGLVIYTPATGADWATAWEQAEYTRKGKMGLSLTNYDNTSLPAIASGSWAEVAGSIYKWTGEEAISGSLSSSAINYIKLIPSGSGDTAIVTATWTADEPTWSDAYQGYYSGTSRYIGGCYYDGTNYNLKIVLRNQHCGFIEKTHQPDGHSYVIANTTSSFYGMDPPLGIITAFSCWVNAGTSFGAGGYAKLLRYEKNTATVVTIADTGTSEGEDTTLTSPEVIDKGTYCYYVNVYNNSGGILNIHLSYKIKEAIRA